MKILTPFLSFVLLIISILVYKKSTYPTLNRQDLKTDYTLIVDRGAFHYDCFELTIDKISYYPVSTNTPSYTKYHTFSQIALDTVTTLAFLTEIEAKGFSKLKDYYSSKTSCTSELSITLFSKGKSKNVICDDFDRDCPELIKYIDKMVVTLEGNNLKRIYLPG
ncbi:MAG: hypothetical protein WBM83_13750 [Flavobacteriaceae bacterium]